MATTLHPRDPRARGLPANLSITGKTGVRNNERIWKLLLCKKWVSHPAQANEYKSNCHGLQENGRGMNPGMYEFNKTAQANLMISGAIFITVTARAFEFGRDCVTSRPTYPSIIRVVMIAKMTSKADPPRYYAACCQTSFDCPADRSGIAPLVKRMTGMIEHAIVGYEPFHDVRLIVFPEFAHAAPIYDSVEKLKSRLAVEIPNEHTDRYSAVAKQYGCYIQTGSFIEYDPSWPDAVFNTTLLIGPTGILSRYRKVNPWIPWEVHASPHDIDGYSDELFPVVTTELGCLGVAICYDWLFPETIRQLTFNGAEVLIRVSAYMDPWGTQKPTDWWTLINRTRALENTAYVVACNQAAQRSGYPPFSWPGGSMIVDYDGRILVQTDPGPHEKIVVGPIDIAALRDERLRRRGHDMRSHLRSEAHTYLNRSIMPAANGEPINIESIGRRIAASKRRLGDN